MFMAFIALMPMAGLNCIVACAGAIIPKSRANEQSRKCEARLVSAVRTARSEIVQRRDFDILQTETIETGYHKLKRSLPCPS